MSLPDEHGRGRMPCSGYVTTKCWHRYVSGLRAMNNISFSLFVAFYGARDEGGGGSKTLIVLAAQCPESA